MKNRCRALTILLFLTTLIACCFLGASLKAYMEAVPLKDKALFYPAQYYKRLADGILCTLCPKYCFLPEGQRGECWVRVNTANRLYTLVYGQPCSVHVDPIEKKPVFHLLPASRAFSIATAGCNLKCSFCQNWEISQAKPENVLSKPLPPQEVIKQAKLSRCESIAYTYTEPVVFYEYMLETAKLAKENGIRNVLVSCGYINPEPFRKLLPYLDIVKIDLKGFNENFYRKVCGAELKNVLASLKLAHTEGKMVEIVNLIIPTLNDNPQEIREMAKWIYQNLGPDVPLFFSRFTPQYRLTNLPPTPVSTLEKARDIAIQEGLNYVYIGNVPGHPAENTYCPRCKKIVIGRIGYYVNENNIKNGKCKFCGLAIPGIWE